MATRSPKTQATADAPETPEDSLAGVSGETISGTPADGDDAGANADAELHPGAAAAHTSAVIKTVTPCVEGVTADDLDLSKLTAVINPDRSGYDGSLRSDGRTIAHIDCGTSAVSALDIKGDFVAAGMPESSIQILRD